MLSSSAQKFGSRTETTETDKVDRRTVIARAACRSCGSSSLAPVLQLGDFYVADFVDSPGVSHPPKIPLELILCQDCTLLQLRHTTPPEWLYRKYWYKSGVNSSMRAAIADITQKAENLASLRPGDSVLDIGCNDGTLLRSYKTPGIRRVGFEPAKNLIAEASVGTDRIINDFFSHAAVAGENFKVVTSIAMFYDLEDPNSFVADVAKSLAPNGIWVIEMHYLPTMLSQNAFDAICHEHLEYYSLTSLLPILERQGLAVLDVETNMINGGSFRIYVQHAGSSRNARNGSQERVERMLADEQRLGLTGRRIYEEFAARVLSVREKVCRFIQQEISQGEKIYVYGASTKGNTILQYFGLDHRTIRAAAERNPEKWGKYTAGTLIPIVSEEQARSEADDFLVLPWHFSDEFKTREQAFLERGGKLIIPLPTPRIIDSSGETELARVVATEAGALRSTY
jgi:NDP-4-keto-2,6-dideoxyhexose 3-C-methyltransferase